MSWWIDLMKMRQDFAFETTFSGKKHMQECSAVRRVRDSQVRLCYLCFPSVKRNASENGEYNNLTTAWSQWHFSEAPPQTAAGTPRS